MADELCDDVRACSFSVSLLDGVTGAGKTETYFEAVSEALEMGKQVVLMLPEIALSNAFLERFKSRFGCAPALWHSHLTPAQRRTTWRGVAQGDTRVVVGARSALFLPYKDLGLIIVDEEHDPAYKQEDGVIYHARDMAVVRGALGQVPVCLVSATPSLETMVNCWDEKYKHLILTSRYGGAHLPDIEVVDLRTDKPERQHFLSRSLLDAVQDTLDKGEQSLLFLNRRGYAPLTLCRTCGHRFECPRCTAWLVEHKASGKLHCHHCGYHVGVPKNCPSCNDEESLAACGPGVERIYCNAVGIALPKTFYAMKISTSDPYLRGLYDRQAAALLSNLTEENDFLKEVKSALKFCLEENQSSAEQVAKHLGLSLRTFYRRLDEQGFRYRSLLADIRFALAKGYLQDETLSLAEIALLLGYSDQSAFTRAFVGWAGATPTEYR